MGLEISVLSFLKLEPKPQTSSYLIILEFHADYHRSCRTAQHYLCFADYQAAGINPVIIGQGEPERAAAYKEEHNIECTILCDPDFTVYSAFGLSNFGIEQLLYDAPKETWCHSKEIGLEFQEARRAMNRPLVDNPWLSPGEFLVDRYGIIRVSYTYQYCENFPDPRVFLTASKIF